MGYYPTDPDHVTLITRGIAFPSGITTNLLDPCCGTGSYQRVALLLQNLIDLKGLCLFFRVKLFSGLLSIDVQLMTKDYSKLTAALKRFAGSLPTNQTTNASVLSIDGQGIRDKRDRLRLVCQLFQREKALCAAGEDIHAAEPGFRDAA